MTAEPANAICLGGPCHGRLVHVDHDSGVVPVPLPFPENGTADYHVTGERVYHGSCSGPIIVLHWNHAIIPSHCRASAHPVGARGTIRRHL
jgi:hypothetical protein